MPHSTSPIGTDIQDGGYGLPRIPIPRTSVNKGKKEGLTEREAKHVRLFDAEKPWSTLVRWACLVRPQTR